MSPGVIMWGAAALVAANGISLAMMGIDKQRARKKQYRISERALMLASACFGALGGMLGMMLFRHKTQHAKFAVGFPLMFAAQMLAILWLWQRAGG